MNLEEKAKARIQELQRERDSLDQRKRDLDLKIEELNNLLKGGKEESQILVRTAPTANWARQILTETLIEHMSGSVRKMTVKMLDENQDKYFNAGQVAEELLKRGFKTTARNFKHSVKTTLNWLSRNRMVKVKEGKGNMKLYTSIHNPQS